MEDLSTFSIGKIPIHGLKKVFDLIEYDGPLLSHFKDKNDSNYFYHWVDNDEIINRWLIWKVSDFHLYSYLNNSRTLEDLLLECEKRDEYIYCADIDATVTYIDSYSLYLSDLPKSYYPPVESYFDSEVPSFYENLTESFDKNGYLALMRDTACYFTVKPRVNTFSTTVSINYAGEFLKKLSSSFTEFVEYNFYNTFKENFRSFDDLNKALTEYKQVLNPRIVETEYSSFKIGISVDRLHGPFVGKEYKDWQRKIFQDFEDEVVNVDYDSEENVEKIVSSYPEEVRGKIFGPYIQIINDSIYGLEVIDHKRNINIKYKKVEKNKVEKITLKKVREEQVEIRKKFVQVILQVPEGRDLKSISKKDLNQSMLSFGDVNSFDESLPVITSGDTTLTLKEPISISYRWEDNKFFAVNNFYDLYEGGVNKFLATNRFKSQFVANYQRHKAMPPDRLGDVGRNYLDIVESESFRDSPEEPDTV